MIWNYIYIFLVKYVFGGILEENGSIDWYGGTIGAISGDDGLFGASSNYLVVNTRDLGFQNGYGMTFGNYLSLVTTIIIMALIVWFAIWLVIWVFKLVAHAFLLK